MTANTQNPGLVKSPAISKYLPPLPLLPLQPVLARIVKTIVRRQPGLFARLGPGTKKKFLIDPTNLPIVFLLEPDPQNPKLTAIDRRKDIERDVYIGGTFMTLLRMIDSQTDSDALFFSRDLKVSGDSEAMVALRNALDDMDSTLADDVAAAFGPLAKPMRSFLDSFNKIAESKS